MTAEPAEPLLVAKGITKRFGSVEALIDVDFDVRAGEVMALVGDNGAGKSTLIKAISGVQPPDAGTFWFDGHRVTIHNPQDAQRLGIATVYQDLALCDALDIVDNLFLGREIPARGLRRHAGALDEREMQRQTAELLRSLGVTSVPNCAGPSDRCPAASASPSPSPARCSASRAW